MQADIYEVVQKNQVSSSKEDIIFMF